MKQTFAKLMLAGLIGLTGLAGTAATASADTLTFGIHSGDVVDVQYRDWDQNRRYRPDWGNERHERRGRCAPWLATEKARDIGLRRAQVVHVGNRRVVVEGRRHGEFRTIAFANVRGCPVLGR